MSRCELRLREGQHTKMAAEAQAGKHGSSTALVRSHEKKTNILHRFAFGKYEKNRA